MSAFRLIHYYSSHLVTFGVLAFSSLNNITLNAANKKTEYSISHFQAGISADAQCTLNNKKHISHTIMLLVDMIAYLSDSDGKVIPG